MSIALLTAGLVALGGCVSSGNEKLRHETGATIQQKVVEGKTTKAEIRQKFGDPLTTSFTDGGSEIWNYELQKISADAIDFVPFIGLLGGSSTGVKKQLVFLFDDKDIVKKYSMSESPVTVKTGLFNQ